jgi:hypothetical protein
VNCRDAERLLDTFFDGELEGRLMREAALHVTRCKHCEAEVVERERLHDLLRGAVEAEMADLDLGRVWRGVSAAIGDSAGRSGRDGSAGWLRLAAASSRVRGVIVGRRRSNRVVRGARDAEDAFDPTGQWLAPRAPGVLRPSWSLAIATALAASLVAVVLVGRSDAPGDALTMGGPDPTAVPSAVAMVRPTTSQVQVESVDYSGRSGHSLAMWTEPETDTTVIWVDDGEAGATE